MLDFNALAQLNQRLETQLALKNIKDPQLKAYFKTGKIGIYSTPNIEKQSEAFFVQALRFSELYLCYTLLSRSQRQYKTAIDNVKFFYDNCLPITKQPKMIAIHLLFLLSENLSEEFFTKLQSLTSNELADSHINYVLLINDALQQGNYRKVFQLKHNNQVDEFVPFLDRISETVRTEIAKSAEKAYSHISMKEALNVFQVSSQEQLKEFIDRFERRSQEQKIPWIVTADRITFEKDSKHKIQFNSNELIRTALLYATELEKIA